jgi:glyoxylase-like metal-dependent hydrolase (beta-lactamase superfamily II)
MEATRVSGSVYMVDAYLLGRPKTLSTYIILGEQKVMIIDPGPPSSIDTVIEAVRRLDVDEILIAPTHIHLDHAGGSWRLLEELGGSSLYIHPRGAPHLVDPSRLLKAARGLLGQVVDFYGEVRGVDPEKIKESSDGDILNLGGVSAETIWTPGHASHHQCYYLVEDEVLILGDAGGIYHPETGTITPTSLPPFNPEKAIESLQRLMGLRAKILCYGHFGYSERGVAPLEAHRRQIELWMRVVEEGMRTGATPKELYERIRRTDPMAKMAWRGRMSERELMNILGFVEYYRWLWSRSNKF